MIGAVGVGVLVTVRVNVAVGVLVTVAVCDAVRVTVAVDVTVAVLVGVRVGVFVGVLVGVCVGVLVDVAVDVLVCVLVDVAVGVLVTVAVSVTVAVFVAVGVSVTVGVSVAVPVSVAVAVSVGVSVTVGVSVGEPAGVSVGVGVACGGKPSQLPSTPHTMPNENTTVEQLAAAQTLSHIAPSVSSVHAGACPEQSRQRQHPVTPACAAFGSCQSSTAPSAATPSRSTVRVLRERPSVDEVTASTVVPAIRDLAPRGCG
jgi:hypothetical protein